MAAKRASQVQPKVPEEPHVSVATTVFWLLSALCALAAEVVVLVTWVLGRFVETPPVALVHRVAIFLGLVTSLVALGMVPVVLRVRSTRPPESALRITYTIACIAMLLAVVMR